MPTKAQAYKVMADETALLITDDAQSWASFLTTASKHYKYSYADQLLIHAQRPDATACAEYDVWNNIMRRYIRRGAKGIALLDPSGEGMRLRYVFDVSDTGERASSRPVDLWQMEASYQEAVRTMLITRFDVPEVDVLDAQLEVTATIMAAAYFTEHQRDILDSVDGSLLSGYDDGSIGASFFEATMASITYILKTRCGMEAQLPDDLSEYLMQWHTPTATEVLGRAINQISGQVLRQIEAVVKHERSVEHDRIEVHPERGLPAAGLGTDRGGTEAAGQVRTDAAELPGGAAPDPAQQTPAERHPDGAPARDRPDGTEPDGADDDRSEERI